MVRFKAAEIHIPDDLWIFVGRELLSRGYLTENVFITATVKEPRIKLFLLGKEVWQTYISLQDFIDLNPIEHAKETQQELEETGVANCIFIKEILKQKDRLENFPERILRENGFMELDNVVLMSEEKSEEWFRKRDAFYLHKIGRKCYYAVHGYRFTMFIHELIHVYEFKLGEPIIKDPYTEEALQDEIFYRYLNMHKIHPKNFKLTACSRTLYLGT